MILKRKYLSKSFILNFDHLGFLQSQFADSNKLNKLACKIELACTLGYIFVLRLAYTLDHTLVFDSAFALATI